MRILSLSSDYPPTPGGISRLSWQTNVALARRHEVRVIAATSSFEAARAFDRRQPYTTRRVRAALGLREISTAWALWNELRVFKPDVVWSAVWFPEAVLASFLVRKPSLQTFSAYAAEFIPSTLSWRQRAKSRLGGLFNRLLGRADRIFALSRYTEEQLLRLGAPSQKIRIIPGGVSDDWFEVKREPRVASRPTLLTVARLDANKGHDTVIRALPAIRRRYPDIAYVIIGPATPYLDTLRQLSRSLGVGDLVEYRGLVSDAELKQAYLDADVFLMISRQEEGYVEGFGLTFLEAAATGLPAVAGRSGGIPDAVEDGVSGLLVDPHSPEKVSEAVLRLLDDPAYRLQMGSRARERAWQSFRWEKVADLLTESFDELTRAVTS